MSSLALGAHVRSFAYDDGCEPLLRNVRLELVPGSLTAVLGASGSGKSTLAKVLAGWAIAGGHGRLDGTLQLGRSGTAERLDFRGLPDDPRLRLGAWGQHVAYVPQRAADLLTGAAATVGEELAFALEQRGTPRAEMLVQVDSAARAVGLGEFLLRDPRRLSGGEQRRLAIACALVGRPDVVLLDEPSASLDAQGLVALSQLVDTLRTAGAAVVVFSAADDPIARAAGHWLLLEGGAVAAEGPPDEVEGSAAFTASGVLREGAATPRAPRLVGGDADAPTPLAELDRVTFVYPDAHHAERRRHREVSGPSMPVLDEASFAVLPGEVVALTGPNGAGKSTSLRHLAGLLRPQGGSVRIGGRDILAEPAGRVAATVGTLFQEPRDQLFERTALREVAFGLAGHRRGFLGASRDEAHTRALEALDAVGLVRHADAHPYELSMSEQRLLALATVLARQPRVLLLDEPTVGLDRFGLARLQAAVRRAAEGGAAVVLSTHALAWARRQADRGLVLAKGRFEEA
ncbi:ABC transporter ATP-binding protein [Sinomonas humi]|uniref:ABC transporter domain-containing protein n=1 Tax=Sinomonas humi TaxID=1338436 RepID=A0A0B2AIG5_9MICC|nr:ATP-binding cassette domain-containing protein [Sinomonas humi]KHL03068.1 hypothetical protein LK10_09745 [Sinomonas humi]